MTDNIDNGENPHYFVMVAGRPKRVGSRVLAVFAFNASEAHETAAKAYRSSEGLASSVHVHTERVHEVATEAEAQRYLDRLAEVMAEDAATNGGNSND